jgi:small-conductance mechanosensitive channel
MQFEEFLPRFGEDWGTLGALGAMLAAALAGYAVHKIVFGILRRWGRNSELSIAHLLDVYLESPLKYLIVLLVVLFTGYSLTFRFREPILHTLTIGLVAAGAFLAIRVVSFARELIVNHYDVKAENNLQARKIYTQFRIIERILVFVIVLFAIAIALLTFEEVRQVGVSLLASAGVIGIIVGFAAQKTLGSLLAGIQIAVAQPIRIDDAVIVEGEFGRVEEINLTYVVLKIWDERRLIVPINYFLDKPFQNWTRVSTDLLGTVFFYLNYNAPVEAMRQELDRILLNHPLWDGKAKDLQVTDVKENSIEVRVLVSSTNSGNTFTLRCNVRENMITFLQKNHPECLPRTRMEVVSLPKTNGQARADEGETLVSKNR